MATIPDEARARLQLQDALQLVHEMRQDWHGCLDCLYDAVKLLSEARDGNCDYHYRDPSPQAR